MSNPIKTKRARAFVILFGFLPGNTLEAIRRDKALAKSNGNAFQAYPVPLWKIAPTGDFWTMTLESHCAPNIIHRILQRLILGVKFKLIH